MKPLLAVALVTAACALVASPAGAALNTFAVTARNTTPGDEVGRNIAVTVTGQILATSKKKLAQRCRSFREVRADYVGVGGVKKRIDFKPASKTGRFKGDFPLDYGGTDPQDPSRTYSGDIDFAGGTLTLRFTVRKTIVKGNKGPFSLFTCKQLTGTAQVQVAPAQT